MIESKLDGKSEDVLSDNILKLREIFPEVFEESKIDFEKLELLLGENVDTGDERYNFTWPGKTDAIRESQKQSTGTLRPCVEESKDWDSTQNLYIEGDNLEVLKLLQKSYYGKVKCIYIDPPYNTGNDIIYKNDYKDNLKNYLEITGQTSKIKGDRESNGIKLSTNVESDGRFHSNWLNMMYPRLKLARNLLSNDGCVVLAIDHYELNNLIDICDEIFGEENKLGIITVVHKPEGRQHAKFFSASNEYMLVYSKNKNFVEFNKVVLSDNKLKEFKERDDMGRFKWKNFIRGDTTKNKKPKAFYPIYVSDDLTEITLNENDNYIKVLPIDNKGKERAWIVLPNRFNDKLSNNEIKAEIDKNTGKLNIFYKIREQQVLTTHWVDKKYNATANGTNVLKKLMGEKVFDFPKSIYLVEDILRIISSKNSIILDLFSGSGTTAHSVMDMNNKYDYNQKFIMVQLPYPSNNESEAFKAGYRNICEIGKERIRRAGDMIVEESGNSDLDIGFKVFKLDSSNLEKWDPDFDNLEQTLLSSQDNIKSDRCDLDLVYEVMLKYGLDLTLPVEKIDLSDNLVYSVGFGALLICLDDNITSDIAGDIIELQKDSEVTRVVFKDNGFASDSDKTNIKETLRTNGIEEFITI
ncbi:site-specific DNA-methyltransferase [Methanobrevibacter boviskoreani]|uniref:site-specific DNA-methyltransferase n=1 Tax=Methanobrevibacter boviskoreani TaxID=1348249 RepID=UPI00059368D5|nr:site-specific DNA-methyltransferase [Methanobrevibacter boviskoreani]